jgi:hypothetical protein
MGRLYLPRNEECRDGIEKIEMALKRDKFVIS